MSSLISKKSLTENGEQPYGPQCRSTISVQACAKHNMEISAKNTNLMTNSANCTQREIKVKGQELGTVTNFKYLGAVVSDDGSKPENLSRIAQATAALTKLKPIWIDYDVSLGSKVKLMRSLVTSIFLNQGS